MTATGRANKRGRVFRDDQNEGESAPDFYRTPEEATETILSFLPTLKTARRIIELGAGDGAIVRVLLKYGVAPERIVCVELDPKRAAACRSLGVRCDVDDALRWCPGNPLPEGHHADLVIGNPPYGLRRRGEKYIPLAMPFVQRALELVTDRRGDRRGQVAQLLKLDYLASIERAKRHRVDAPSVFVLSRRPTFMAGGQDSSGFAWIVYDPGGPFPPPGKVYWPPSPEDGKQGSLLLIE